jgi:regulatory protein
MARKDVPEDVAEQVLDRFEEVRLVDDAAYAEMWVRSRHAGRGLARRAIAQELRRRGVADEVAGEALSQLDDEAEVDAARELVRRKLPGTRRLDRDARIRRLAGMLGRKGYSAGVALRVVRDALDAEGEDVDDLGE